VYIQIFSLLGAICGSGLGFLGISSAQANSCGQARGFFSNRSIPPDMVITLRAVHFGAVFFTITACLIMWRIYRVETDLYDVQISLDKIGILVEAEPSHASLREIFTSHHALEISGSV